MDIAEKVKEIVAQQRDEAGQHEAREDLLPQHLPVAAEVVRHVGPRVGRGQPLAPGQARARRSVLVAGVDTYTHNRKVTATTRGHTFPVR